VWDFIVGHYNKSGRPPTEQVLLTKWDCRVREYPVPVQLLMRRLSRMSHGPLHAYVTFVDSGIPEVYVKDPWLPVLQFVQRYTSDYAVPPTADVLSHEFPKLKLLQEPPSVAYMLDKLKERHLYQLGVKALQEAHALFADRKIHEGWELIQAAALEAQHDLRPARDVDLTSKAAIEQRIRGYNDRKSVGGITGVEWFLPSLTEATLGKQRGQIILIVARQGIGKTWMEVIDAEHVWRQGHTPMIITKEMGVWEIIARFDAMYAKVPHASLRAARLGDLVEQSFFAALRALEGFHPFIVVGDDAGSSTVSHIAAKVAQYRPGVVYVDGGYMLDDEEGAQSTWEKITNITRGLKKRVARAYGVPVVITLQLNKQGAGLEGLDADNIALGDVAKEFDHIVGLYQDRDMRERQVMLAKELKQREGQGLWERELRWNFETMEFHELRDPNETALDDPTDADDLNGMTF